MILLKQKNTKQNLLPTLSLSIIVHLVIGALFIFGLSSDMNYTLGLSKADLLWVSLPTGSGKALPSQGVKNNGPKQFLPNKAPVPVTTAKDIVVQSYERTKSGSSKTSGAAVKDNSGNPALSNTMQTAGSSSAFVTANPLYRENAPPVYPAIAKLRGYEGLVMVNAEILPDGRVGSAAISKSSGYAILDQSAIAAVKLWRFEPAKKEGKPFAIRVKLPIKFVLHDNNSQS